MLFSYRGYGRYCPYAEFLFSGEVEVTHRRDDIPTDGWGWRVGYTRWVYLRGKIIPTFPGRLEAAVRKLDLTTFSEVVKQGHLTISRVANLPSRWLHWEKIMVNTRRRVYNHQFFGDCRVLWLGNKTGWLVVIPPGGTVQVVSPDHLMEPITLGSGWYVATHPDPRDD